MTKVCLTLATVALLTASPAFAQYARVIDACSRDATRFCGPGPATGPLIECIKAHFQELTEPCKSALVRIPDVLKACGEDVQKQCPGIRPSAGRVVLCTKKHFAALSDPCKEAIGRAAERRLVAH